MINKISNEDPFKGINLNEIETGDLTLDKVTKKAQKVLNNPESSTDALQNAKLTLHAAIEHKNRYYTQSTFGKIKKAFMDLFRISFPLSIIKASSIEKKLGEQAAEKLNRKNQIYQQVPAQKESDSKAVSPPIHETKNELPKDTIKEARRSLWLRNKEVITDLRDRYLHEGDINLLKDVKSQSRLLLLSLREDIMTMREELRGDDLNHLLQELKDDQKIQENIENDPDYAITCFSRAIQDIS